jgi:polysaccharide export outer membrane protein
MPVSKLKYLNDIDDIHEPIINPREQKLIMPYDRINISVLSIDEKTNQLFNSLAATPIGATGISGYLVDVQGNINFPFVGKINIRGLAPEQASSKIANALTEYGFNATVTVSFVEKNISLLGEVQGQGVFSFTQDKINVYEALALGGGITRFGDRKNVILIRQEGDRIMHHKLDLSDSRIAGRELYYLQANDILIVEPIRSTSWFNFNSATLSTFIGSLTTVLVILSFFFQPLN